MTFYNFRINKLDSFKRSSSFQITALFRIVYLKKNNAILILNLTSTKINLQKKKNKERSYKEIFIHFTQHVIQFPNYS